MDKPSFVVTGGAQGVGRAVVERLAVDGSVVVLDVATGCRVNGAVLPVDGGRAALGADPEATES